MVNLRCVSLVSIICYFLHSSSFAYAISNEDSTKRNASFYYSQINKCEKNFAISSDSGYLHDLYQEIFRWNNEVVTNCFFYTLEEAQIYYLNNRQFYNLKKTFIKQMECGLGNGMLNYYINLEEYSDFFNSNYDKQLIDTFNFLNLQYLKSINLIYYSAINSLLEKDQFARNVLYGSLENSWLGKKLEVFENLPDSLNMKIMYSLMKHTDSICFENIITLIDNYGFPSESRVGKGGLGYLYAHLYGCPGVVSSSGIQSQVFFDSILPIAVMNLEISNRSYAFEKDYSTSAHSSSCNEPYCTFGSSINMGQGKRAITGEIIAIENVDKRRAEIYLPPLWVDALIYNFVLPDGYPLPEEAKKYFQKR